MNFQWTQSGADCSVKVPFWLSLTNSVCFFLSLDTRKSSTHSGSAEVSTLYLMFEEYLNTMPCMILCMYPELILYTFKFYSKTGFFFC